MGASSAGSSGGGGGGNQQAKARRLMTTTPNYAKPKRKSVTAGTLSDPREKDDTAAKASLFKETGATKIKNTQMGSASIAKPFFQEGSRKTRDYFKKEVLGKGAYKGTSLEDFESKSLTEQENIYQDYIQGRTAGTKDAYGRDITPPRDDAPKGIEVAKAASSEPLTETVQKAAVETAPDGPTSVEMDSEEDEARRLLRIKRAGRRATILNVPDEELTLSRRVLLG